MKEEDNRTSSLFFKLIRHSLSYCFDVDADLSLSKVNMKDILYTPHYTTSFFSGGTATLILSLIKHSLEEKLPRRMKIPQHKFRMGLSKSIFHKKLPQLVKNELGSIIVISFPHNRFLRNIVVRVIIIYTRYYLNCVPERVVTIRLYWSCFIGKLGTGEAFCEKVYLKILSSRPIWTLSAYAKAYGSHQK
ncbi:hypothetical protein H8356DRAFT_1428039 [Neocallimastix lanati (nom. inval.)]|nr:hypothetical protein H8356DRAFT_1428039 [Neocallimastix sp. JGI-2020a]